MSDADFALMLKYIDGLKGNARSLTVTKAEKLLVAASSSDEEEDDSEKKPSEGKYRNHISHSTATHVTFSLKIIFYWYLTYIITTVNL